MILILSRIFTQSAMSVRNRVAHCVKLKPRENAVSRITTQDVAMPRNVDNGETTRTGVVVLMSTAKLAVENWVLMHIPERTDHQGDP